MRKDNWINSTLWWLSIVSIFYGLLGWVKYSYLSRRGNFIFLLTLGKEPFQNMWSPRHKLLFQCLSKSLLMQQTICKWQNKITSLSNCVKRKCNGNWSHVIKYTISHWALISGPKHSYSFTTYLLSIYIVLGIILNVRDAGMNKTKTLTLKSLHSFWGRNNRWLYFLLRVISAMDKNELGYRVVCEMRCHLDKVLKLY